MCFTRRDQRVDDSRTGLTPSPFHYHRILKKLNEIQSYRQLFFFFYPHTFLMRSGLSKLPHHDSFAHYYGKYFGENGFIPSGSDEVSLCRCHKNPLQGRYHQESLTERTQMAQAVHQVCGMIMNIIIKSVISKPAHSHVQRFGLQLSFVYSMNASYKVKQIHETSPFHWQGVRLER